MDGFVFQPFVSLGNRMDRYVATLLAMTRFIFRFTYEKRYRHDPKRLIKSSGQ
jgi:hypothetical protein